MGIERRERRRGVGTKGWEEGRAMRRQMKRVHRKIESIAK
jgi:hypothetical protein